MVVSSPMTSNALQEEKEVPNREELNFLIKQLTARLEKHEQVVKELRNELCRIEGFLQPNDRELISGERVSYSPHIGPRGIGNRGGRPHGYSTFRSRGAHKSVRGRGQKRVLGLDYTEGSQAGPTQPLDPMQESMTQTSVPVTPGTHLRFLFNLSSSVYVRDWARSGQNIRPHLFTKSYFTG